MITKKALEDFLNDSSLQMSRKAIEISLEEELNKPENKMDTELVDLCIQSLLEIDGQTSSTQSEFTPEEFRKIVLEKDIQCHNRRKGPFSLRIQKHYSKRAFSAAAVVVILIAITTFCVISFHIEPTRNPFPSASENSEPGRSSTPPDSSMRSGSQQSVQGLYNKAVVQEGDIIQVHTISLRREGKTAILNLQTTTSDKAAKVGFSSITLQQYNSGKWVDYKEWKNQYSSGKDYQFTMSVPIVSGYNYRIICNHYAENPRFLWLTDTETFYNETKGLHF